MIRLPGLEAARQPVDFAEARRHAREVLAGLVQLRDPLEALLEQRLDVAELGRDAALRELEDDLLGLVDELGRLARPFPAEPRDLCADADEPAQGRHLADDLRVVRRVRRRRDERRQLVDPLAAAGVLQVAALLELVDERDRVDRLAAGVERERGAVDLRVALPVEVPRVEDFADRPDRTGGEHHRAEDGLLSVEILRWDRGGLRRLDDCGHVGISGGWKRQFQRLDNLGPPIGAGIEKAAACRVRERTFARLSPACRTSSPARRTDFAPEFRAVSGFFVKLSTARGRGCGKSGLLL